MRAINLACRRIVMHTRRAILALMTVVAVTVALAPVTQHAASNFTIEQIKSYPFPNELTASATGSRIAWAFNERGARNVWVAEGPDFKARRLTNYESDDGQELTSLSISADGKYLVYVRGGDHGSNFDSSVGVNPAIGPAQMKVQIWSAPFGGGEPKLLGEGDEPLISPKSDRVVFAKDRGLWTAPLDGSSGHLTARGWPSFPIAATIPSSAFIQTIRHRSSISRLPLLATRAHDGHLTESESRLCDGPATAAHPNRCSTNDRRHGPSGLPMQAPARDNSSGRARSRCVGLRPARTAEQTCTGPPLVASSFSPTSTAGRIFTRSQKWVASLCC
jgi:hypothetical protein